LSFFGLYVINKTDIATARTNAAYNIDIVIKTAEDTQQLLVC